MSAVVVFKMAPLDLDKYVEIARQCKYLPENDLKVSMNIIFIRVLNQYPNVSTLALAISIILRHQYGWLR